MNRIAFRADVSPLIGMGHLMRCLSLSRQMDVSDGCVLITRSDDRVEETVAPAEDAGWDIDQLSSGLTDKEDAAATAATAARVGADLVVTDLCSRDFIERSDRLSKYHIALRENLTQPLLSIEDCRMHSFTSDVAVIPYDCGDNGLAERAIPGCRVHAGTEFYICDNRLASWRNRRVIRPRGSKILVALGGSDPLGIAIDVATALSASPEGQYQVRVIIGHGLDADQRMQLQRIANAHESIETVDFCDDIGQQLIWADIAVLGEGLIRFEAAITGTPSITISQFEHESDVLERFYATGTTVYLGPAHTLTPDRIRSSIAALARSPKKRRNQSEAGMKIYDGKGIDRIAAIAAQMTSGSKDNIHADS